MSEVPPPDPRDAAILAKLDGSFAVKIKRVLAELRKKGWKARIKSGLRTVSEQREIVRSKKSNRMRSSHVCGLGADIIDSRYAWSIPTNHDFWTSLGAAAKAEGLTWGGNFSWKDVAHVEVASYNCDWDRYGLSLVGSWKAKGLIDGDLFNIKATLRREQGNLMGTIRVSVDDETEVVTITKVTEKSSGAIRLMYIDSDGDGDFVEGRISTTRGKSKNVVDYQSWQLDDLPLKLVRS